MARLLKRRGAEVLMNKKRIAALVCAFALLVAGSFAFADDRPHDGKIISIDKQAMSMVVQGEKNDQWTLYWTETSKLKGDVTIPELKVGDKVHFEYAEKDGKMWLTELKRTERAKS
jgi:hypothetical protein